MKILKYNKSFQNKLDINIKHYAFYSGRYIIYDSKGKGKEYNGYTDDLINEGEYINGERNGQGKEYDELSNLIYEGEFKNGKRNGQGKCYFGNKLTYEGEFKEGKRNGKGRSFIGDKLAFEGEFIDEEPTYGKYYDKEGNIKEAENGNGIRRMVDHLGNLIFIGEYSNYKRNGKGKEYFSGTNLLLYEGEYLDGKKNGKGKEYIYFGGLSLRFEGEFLNGKRNGKGKVYFNNTSVLYIEGEYLNGAFRNAKFYAGDNILCEIKNGKGKMRNIDLNEKNELIFMEIEYLNGELNGKGKVYNIYGLLIFEGEYLNNKRNGKGKEYNEVGELLFEGEYLEGHRLNGKEYREGKLEFEGEYLFDKKFNGKGFDENGNKKYELINGNGTALIYYYDSSRYEGEIKNGNINGKGKAFNKNGELVYDGDYLNGKFNGQGKIYINNKLFYEGKLLNGKANGQGKLYSKGNLVFEGEFINGKPWNGEGKKMEWKRKRIFCWFFNL